MYSSSHRCSRTDCTATAGKVKVHASLLTRVTNDPFKVLKTREGAVAVYAFLLHVAALYMYTHPCPPCL